MERLHYIAHTHWDKEWYKTYEEFRVKFIHYFQDILKILEENDQFKHFMFDGQSSIIEDYLQLFPQEHERLKKLIQSKKLLVGPWYTLPDNYLTSGESLTRNLLIGSMIAQQFGYSQRVCYLPDSFGQTDQMPQIIKDFNFKGAILWRGVDSTMTNDAAFIWKGSDGSSVLAIHLPLGYGYSKRIPEDGTHFDYINDIEQRLSLKYQHSAKLLMGGSDHEPIQKNLVTLINEINQSYQQKKVAKEIFISNLDDFFDEYQNLVNKNQLTVLEGELRSVRDQRLHFGDASSRMDLKQLNRKLETKLAEIVEPILVLNHQLYHYKYPRELLNYCWKQLFANQAHDSACTTCTDEVHQEILMRYLKVEQITNELISYANKNMIEQLSPNDQNELFVVYNTNLSECQDQYRIIHIETILKHFKIFNYDNQEIDYLILETQKIDKMQENVDYCNYISMVDAAEDFKNQNKGQEFKKTKQMAHRLTLLVKTEDFKPLSINVLKIVPTIKSQEKCQINDQTLEFKSEFGKYQVNENGTISTWINQQKFENLCYFESRGEAGDSYDYSPPKNDEVYNTLNQKPQIKVLSQSKYSKKIEVIYHWSLPKSLDRTRTKRSQQLKTNKIVVVYRFYSFKKNFEVDVLFENKSQDHLISMNLNLKETTFQNYAGQQFGSIKRKNYLTNDNDWQKTSRSFNYALYPMQKYCAIFNGKEGLMVFTNDSSEYKVSENKILRVILLRSFGYMGQANLKFRPGRPSGIYWKTPDSFLNKKMNYQFKISLFKGKNEFSQVLNYVYNESFELVCKEFIKDIFFKPSLQKTNYLNNSFLKINHSAIILSTMKLSEFDDSIILRLYNPTSEVQKNVKIDLNHDFEVYLSNLNEAENQKLGFLNVIKITEFLPNQFKTFKLK